MRRERKQISARRKNFLPTLIVTFLLWTITAGFVYFIEPETLGAVPGFFVLIFLALFFSFSIIFSNKRRGFLITSGLTFFLLLCYFGIGNILNLLLVLAVLVTLELYFLKK